MVGKLVRAPIVANDSSIFTSAKTEPESSQNIREYKGTQPTASRRS